MNRPTSSPVLPLLLLLAAGAAVGAAWLLSGDEPVGASRAYAIVDGAGVDPPPRSRPGESPAADPARPDETPAAATVTRAAASSGEPVSRLEGRVAFPAGAPHDPTLTVLALGPEGPPPEGAAPGDRSWERRPVLARAPVAADGTFALAVPTAAADEVVLDLDGTFLFLSEPVPPRADPAVLEPELGGAIRGTLVLPSGAAAPPAVAHVGAMGTSLRSAGMMRTTRIEETLEFELRALRPGLRYALWANFDVFPGVVRQDATLVSPGAWTEVRIPMQAGATVRGRVVGEDGAPIAGAEVSADVGASFTTVPGAGRTSSDDGGRFVLRGLAPRPQKIRVRADEHLDGESAMIELVDGAAHDAVRIVLAAGEELRGTVRWPDGTAAAGARLIVVPLDGSGGSWRLYERTRSAEGSARTADDGTFRVASLEAEEYGVYVESPRAGDPDDDRAAWSARAAPVEAGTADLVLTLAPPTAFAGRVLDDAGEAADTFTVVAWRADWPGWTDGPEKEVEAEFTDAAGRFALAGVDPGDWFLSVRSDAHLGSDSRRVTVRADGTPADDADAEFVLTRTGRLSGRVLDPEGRPVADAHVFAAAQEFPGASDGVPTDDEGRFVLPSIGPGPVGLNATSDAWAPSVEEFVDLAPGERRDGHVIRLTRGGALAGVVYDAAGAPDAGRAIVVQSSAGELRELESDSAGRFRADHLAPGAYQVIATPDDEAVADDPGHPSLGALFGQLRMATATVVEGGTVEVVLGLPPRAPVTVAGRVLEDGTPVPAAEVLVLPEQGGFLEGMRGASVDEDGRYEVTLDAPGPYTFVVLAEREVGAEVDFPVTVPEVERYALDLELPGGSIAGVVRGPDGTAPPSAMVWIRREDGVSDLSGMMGGGSILVEDDGSFVVETLHPGRYAITATGPEHGVTTLHGVVVANGARTDGVEVRLAAAARIEGVVFDATGERVADAMVQLSDVDGRPLHGVGTRTRHDGSFSIERVPAGELLVTARTRDRAAPPVRARAAADATVRVELSLRPGVVVRVALEDEDGGPVRAALRVEDEHGRERAGGTSEREIETLAAEGLLSSERRVGPLEPGTYVVRATAADGRTGEVTVTLAAERPEEVVRLRLRAE